MFGFENLEVWQLAIDFADDVYTASESFPVEERFGLTSQIRRAAVSISSNVAEGSGRGSKKDFGRFVGIAYGSMAEVVSLATIARRREFLDEATYRDVYVTAERLGRMLSGLRNSLQRSEG